VGQEIKQAKVLIKGRVQMVNYRTWTKSKADELGLKGWVRNTSDGSVEALLQGSKEKIDEMITLCKEGPKFAKVDSLDIAWQEADAAIESFEILR